LKNCNGASDERQIPKPSKSRLLVPASLAWLPTFRARAIILAPCLKQRSHSQPGAQIVRISYARQLLNCFLRNKQEARNARPAGRRPGAPHSWLARWLLAAYHRPAGQLLLASYF